MEVKFYVYTRHPKTRIWKENSALGIRTNFRFGSKAVFKRIHPESVMRGTQ